jgi:hypothetical protein
VGLRGANSETVWRPELARAWLYESPGHTVGHYRAPAASAAKPMLAATSLYRRGAREGDPARLPQHPVAGPLDRAGEALAEEHGAESSSARRGGLAGLQHAPGLYEL